ncbi:hypothetical protein ACFL20_11330 [Spirochaetota bacterium]
MNFSSLSVAQENQLDGTTKIDDSKKADIKKRSRNINIDAKMMYGQYNNLLASFSVTQSLENFTYQLSSNLVRSDDFGYENSSFYENDIGFSSKTDITESWKLFPEIEIKNESHGMFDNAQYSREYRDRVFVNLKNEYRPTPSRLRFNLGGIYDVHRLKSAQSVDVNSSSFNKINESIEYEYILSASNKVEVKQDFSYYNYSHADNDEFDIDINSELIFSFKLFEYIKVEPGIIFKWNHDNESLEGCFPSGRINVSSIGLKYLSLELSYVYNLVPFKPEDLNLNNKFIMPNYSLPPGKVHHVDFKSDFDLSFDSKRKIYVKNLKFKVSSFFEKNDHFYNYLTTAEDMLSSQSLSAMIWNGRGDAEIDFSIFNNDLIININYEYYHFISNNKITFRPEHVFGGNIKYRCSAWELELDNKFIDKVYTDPMGNSKENMKVIGSVLFQLRMVESFYLYTKVNNLYNYKYSHRPGYPESGITFHGGLRVII